MERVLGNTNKVLVNDKSGNLFVLPLEQMLKARNNNSEMKNDQYNSNSAIDNHINASSPLNSTMTQSTQNSSSTDNTNNIRSVSTATRTGR